MLTGSLVQNFTSTVTYLGNSSSWGRGGSESVSIEGRFEENVSKLGTHQKS